MVEDGQQHCARGVGLRRALRLPGWLQPPYIFGEVVRPDSLPAIVSFLGVPARGGPRAWG